MLYTSKNEKQFLFRAIEIFGRMCNQKWDKQWMGSCWLLMMVSILLSCGRQAENQRQDEIFAVHD